MAEAGTGPSWRSGSRPPRPGPSWSSCASTASAASSNLKRLLAERPTPIVFTVRRGADGGLWRGDEEKRLLLIREAIVAGVDYVDLELDIAKSIPRFGKTKRIVSYHNFRETPADLEDIVAQAREANARRDQVRHHGHGRSATPAGSSRSPRSRRKSVPTIGIAMGPLGVFTRVLGRKFGAPFTYAGFNPERTFAPGMLNYHRAGARLLLRPRSTPTTEVYAVIGDPIGHSLSPAIHNAAFRRLGTEQGLRPPADPRRQAEGVARRRSPGSTSRA